MTGYPLAQRVPGIRSISLGLVLMAIGASGYCADRLKSAPACTDTLVRSNIAIRDLIAMSKRQNALIVQQSEIIRRQSASLSVRGPQ